MRKKYENKTQLRHVECLCHITFLSDKNLWKQRVDNIQFKTSFLSATYIPKYVRSTLSISSIYRLTNEFE